MIRVLLVQDNPGGAKRAIEMLWEQEKGELEVTHVERLSSALRRLNQESFDAIVMDQTLVDTHGLDALDLIQAALCRLPIVVLGEKDNEAADQQMIQHGAQEVVMKDGSTAAQLTRAIRHAVERKKAEQNLSYLAQPWVIDKKETPVTVSLGLVAYPFDGQEIDGLFTSAKAAMESAREAGGNRYCFPLFQAA